MGSSQSSCASKNDTKKSWSSTSRTRGRKSTNLYTEAPHGLRSSVVSMPSDPMVLHDLDVTGPESVHSDDVDNHHADINKVAVNKTTESEEEEDGALLGKMYHLPFGFVTHVLISNLPHTISEIEEDEEWEERLRVLEDARQLKRMAEFFLHPETPVPSSVGARCYFDRSSAPAVNSEEDEDQQAVIRADLAALKQKAIDFLHPEIKVETSDPCACGRNYSSRASADEYETTEEMKEKDRILSDSKMIHQMATDFMHPEVLMKGSIACARNYFTRYGAPECEMESEREQVLADALCLKQSVTQFLHPEIPMTSSGACARNYFTRASAPEYESSEEVAERSLIHQDLQQLLKSAMDYLHPEIQVVTTDATTLGRDYFRRYSAPELEGADEVMERAKIFEDIKLLQKAAKDCLHPELPVATADPTAFGRNYFLRASASEQESKEGADIGKQILEDANAFHQLAVEYLHPELPVVIYATAAGRNYFSRGSAPEYESLHDTDARLQLMEDLKAFKSLAVDFLHPELPVVIYATSTGRNYFLRPDAQERETPEEIEERQRILADAKALKQVAEEFLHPERPVVTTDGAACGRNYFTRFSAPHFEGPEDNEERAQILAEAAVLKKLAADYMHPERPVVSTDGTAFGRNYFNRFSAPNVEGDDERAQILAEAAELKNFATQYLHPEVPIKSTVACARNYFDRPSSKSHYQMIHSFPAHEDDDNSDHHHELDHFGMIDEEMELYNDLRAELAAFPMEPPTSTSARNAKFASKADSEVESNLSRSPSSVFLFGMDE
jgi:hypothetical protein